MLLFLVKPTKKQKLPEFTLSISSDNNIVRLYEELYAINCPERTAPLEKY